MNKATSHELSAMSSPRQRGFTLIEVLVASSILAIVAGAVLQVSQAAIRSHDTALVRTQAYQLVQEGLEIVHTIRDAALADGVPGDWQASFPVDSRPVYALWDPAPRRYDFESGSDLIELDGTTFTRTYTFLPPPDLPPLTDQFGEPVADESLLTDLIRRVEVKVVWTSLGRDQSVEGTTVLTDWRPAG